MNTDKIYAESIAKEYAPKDSSKIVALRKLDAKAKLPANVFTYTFGIITHSWWLFTVGLYYVILSVVRFVVLRTKKNHSFATKFTGGMLMLLSLLLVGTVILAVARDREMVLHEIVMITMALYAFTKITLATVNLVKARRSASAQLITLRNISFADAFVSIFSLQRSMLVSFEGMNELEIQIMNASLGSAVCVIVFLLGLNLVRSKKIMFANLNKS